MALPCPALKIMTNPFYVSKEWRRLRKEVLAKHKSECQYCKAKGIYTKATHVHHGFHLDKHPEYALDEYVGEEKNLIPVCRECHETVCHPERLRHWKEPLTKERW